MATIQGVYVALFGRPADPTGLAYFNSVTNNGANLNAIGNLASTSEYQARFTGLNNIQIINTIYQSLFGRDADLTGLTFFSDALAKGTLNINNVAIAILDGAQGTDKTIVTNKVAAADLYTKALDTGSEVVAYSGLAAAAQGRAFVSGVTTTVPTAAAVDAAVATMVSASTGGGTGTVGVTLTLASGAAVSDFISPDQANSAFKTTANNDTIRAVAAADFASIDSIDGGAGTDTLNAPFASATTLNPVLKSVEIVNLGAAGAANQVAVTSSTNAFTFDSSASTGIQQISVSNANLTAAATTTGGAINLNNTDKSVVASFKDIAVTAGAAGTDNANLTVAYTNTTGTNDSVTVGVSNINAVANGVLNVNTAGIENVTINSTGATGTSSSFTLNDAQLVKLTVTGDKDVTILNAAGNAAQKTVDASAFTGTLNYTATGNGETITGGQKADFITLGGGNDTIVYTAANKSTVTALDTITGFNANSADKIDVKVLGLASTVTVGQYSTTNTQITSDFTGFFSGNSGNDKIVKQVVGADVFVYIDANNDGNFNAGTDVTIKLAGIAANVANVDKADFILA